MILYVNYTFINTKILLILWRRKTGARDTKVKGKVSQLCSTLATPWTIKSMEFSRPEYKDTRHLLKFM